MCEWQNPRSKREERLNLSGRTTLCEKKLEMKKMMERERERNKGVNTGTRVLKFQPKCSRYSL